MLFQLVNPKSPSPKLYLAPPSQERGREMRMRMRWESEEARSWPLETRQREECTRRSGSKEGRSRVVVNWGSSQGKARTRDKRQQQLEESSILSMRESWSGWSQRGSKCVWAPFLFGPCMHMLLKLFGPGWAYYCILYAKPKHVWQPTTKCFVLSMYICSMMISYLINYARHKAQKGKTPDGCWQHHLKYDNCHWSAGRSCTSSIRASILT